MQLRTEAIRKIFRRVLMRSSVSYFLPWVALFVVSNVLVLYRWSLVPSLDALLPKKAAVSGGSHLAQAFAAGEGGQHVFDVSYAPDGHGVLEVQEATSLEAAVALCRAMDAPVVVRAPHTVADWSHINIFTLTLMMNQVDANVTVYTNDTQLESHPMPCKQLISQWLADAALYVSGLSVHWLALSVLHVLLLYPTDQ